VSVDVTSRTLGINRRAAAKLLSRWKQQGWLRRIGHGLYVPVPLDLAGSEQVIADPWVLVPTLFNQCYIGGWTAAHHWELTEQLFMRPLSSRHAGLHKDAWSLRVRFLYCTT